MKAEISLGIVGSRKLEAVPQAVEMVVEQMLDTINPTKVVSGGARGVDSIAENVARRRGIEVTVIRPNWKPFGPDGPIDYTAGFARNGKIVDQSDALVAIMVPGGSRGTEDSISKAEKKGIPVFKTVIESSAMPPPKPKGKKTKPIMLPYFGRDDEAT